MYFCLFEVYAVYFLAWNDEFIINLWLLPIFSYLVRITAASWSIFFAIPGIFYRISCTPSIYFTAFAFIFLSISFFRILNDRYFIGSVLFLMLRVIFFSILPLQTTLESVCLPFFRNCCWGSVSIWWLSLRSLIESQGNSTAANWQSFF